MKNYNDPRMTPEAQARIDGYTYALARRSRLPFQAAEEARRSIARRVRGMARSAADAEGAPEVFSTHVLEAIRTLGDDATVEAQYFSDTGGLFRFLPARRRFVAVIASLAGLASVAALVVGVIGVQLPEIFLWTGALALAGFGSVAVTTLRSWASLVAGFALALAAVVTYAVDGNNLDWLNWLGPALLITVGSVVRGDFRVVAEPGPVATPEKG